jgi:hypothetical protein
LLHVIDGPGHGWESNSKLLSRRRNREDRMRLRILMNAENRRRRAAQRFYLSSVGIEERNDSSRSID